MQRFPQVPSGDVSSPPSLFSLPFSPAPGSPTHPTATPFFTNHASAGPDRLTFGRCSAAPNPPPRGNPLTKEPLTVASGERIGTASSTAPPPNPPILGLSPFTLYVAGDASSSPCDRPLSPVSPFFFFQGPVLENFATREALKVPLSFPGRPSLLSKSLLYYLEPLPRLGHLRLHVHNKLSLALRRLSFQSPFSPLATKVISEKKVSTLFPLFSELGFF